MKKVMPFLLYMSISWLLVVSCSEARQDAGDDGGAVGTSKSNSLKVQPLPEELKVGESKFNANCSRCHGRLAKGTTSGPPLVHKIYEPSHHADFAFQRAAAQGVRAHHWKFGNMPSIPSVTPDDVKDIIAYVRWLQRQAGIY